MEKYFNIEPLTALLKRCIVVVLHFVVVMVSAQEPVSFSRKQKKVDVMIAGKPFTSFVFSDTLEKPVLYPVLAANGATITRGFPLNPRSDEPTDHPHHVGVWFNFENVNGLDFWNNSYAIPAEKKVHYGWIRTDENAVSIEYTDRNTYIQGILDEPGWRYTCYRTHNAEIFRRWSHADHRPDINLNSATKCPF